MMPLSITCYFGQLKPNHRSASSALMARINNQLLMDLAASFIAQIQMITGFHPGLYHLFEKPNYNVTLGQYPKQLHNLTFHLRGRLVHD